MKEIKKSDLEIFEKLNFKMLSLNQIFMFMKMEKSKNWYTLNLKTN